MKTECKPHFRDQHCAPLNRHTQIGYASRLAVLPFVMCAYTNGVGQRPATPSVDMRGLMVSADFSTAAYRSSYDPKTTAGPIQLSLQEAIRMALQNNLDIKLEQGNQPAAAFGVERAEGGGLPTQINYGIAEAPVGVGLTAMPLLTMAAPSSVDPSGISVSSSYDAAHVLQANHSLSISQGAYSPGSAIPAYDAAIQGQFSWLRRNPVTSITAVGSSTPANTLITDNTLGNTTFTKGFSSGASVQLGVNNFTQSLYSGRSSAVPFSKPNAIALFVQPLLRGSGRTNNTRYVAIAKANKQISAAVLEQQMISTISGTENLYYDLVGLQDSVAVQEDALKAANQLLSNDRQQLNVGRMSPIEVARAEALVSANQLALTRSISLRDQQRITLQFLLDPQSLKQAGDDLPELVATNDILPPSDGIEPPVGQLIRATLTQRPDIRQAQLQLANGQRSVAGSANAVLPEVDLYISFQNRGTIAPGILPITGDATTGESQIEAIPAGGKSVSRIFEAGIQFNLALHNRVALASLGSDRVEFRQERMRLIELESQAAAEVRNTLIGLVASRKAAQSAKDSRILQERLLGAEMERFRAGISSNFAVIEQETYLTQARTTEIAARAACSKAMVEFERAMGETLQNTGFAIDRVTGHNN